MNSKTILFNQIDEEDGSLIYIIKEVKTK